MSDKARESQLGGSHGERWMARISDDDLVDLVRRNDTYRQEYVEELKRRGWAESHPDDDYDPEDA